MMQTVRYCGDCGGERPFEQPHEPGECPDHLDGECPELSCTACGAALLTGVALLPGATVLPSRTLLPGGTALTGASAAAAPGARRRVA